LFEVNINEKNIMIRNINKEDINYIVELYSNYNKYIYAFGLNIKQSIKEIQSLINTKKENAKSTICIILYNNKKIGIIKLNVVNNRKYNMWINYILIDEEHQRKKLGSSVIDLIEEYFSKNFFINEIYISVVKSNISGYKFWTYKQYALLDVLKEHITINNKNEDVVIMSKIIKESP
jgi:RimJ/RimL family protein N-acetyltransferase